MANVDRLRVCSSCLLGSSSEHGLSLSSPRLALTCGQAGWMIVPFSYTYCRVLSRPSQIPQWLHSPGASLPPSNFGGRDGWLWHYFNDPHVMAGGVEEGRRRGKNKTENQVIVIWNGTLPGQSVDGDVGLERWSAVLAGSDFFHFNIIIIAFKGAVRDLLQSPSCAANRLQHVRSSGQDTIVWKSRATHRAPITCNMLRATW